jgi:uncharacterized protein (DUF1800 family)
MTAIHDAHHALNRFGLGSRPGEAEAMRDPDAWLLAQISAKAVAESAHFAALPNSLDYLHRESDYSIERAKAKKAAAPTPDFVSMAKNSQNTKKAVQQKLGFKRVFGEDFNHEFRARYTWASTTTSGFRERLTRFWSNHFAVSLDKRVAALYAAPMEREAIRPRIDGKYENMLLAVAQHPAMLRYLDNVTSVGSASKLAGRQQQRVANQKNKGKLGKLGLNENLAREILELHTLGVDGGYTQNDVTEFARALTGWSMPRRRQLSDSKPTSVFQFHEQAHEPGARTVLGKRYADDGENQARSILIDLAQHPATAKHLATKLTRHFVADEPPTAMVARLTKVYIDHQGDMSVVYRALINSPEAWNAEFRKLRTPDDWLVAALRASSINIEEHFRPSMDLLEKMGQPVLTPRSPAGYADRCEDWSGPDALYKRVQAAQAIADWVARDRDPLLLAQTTLGAELDADTSLSLRRAESPQQAYALLFASPAFQWR